MCVKGTNMLPFSFIIFSILEFLITNSLEATLSPALEITKRCTNQPKLVSKSIPTKKLSKWLEDDSNRKQFELVNKSWRKTNIFVDAHTSTAPNPIRTTIKKNFQTKPSEPIKKSSTPSFFEFYYYELEPASKRTKYKITDKDTNWTNKNKFQDTFKSKFLKYPLQRFGELYDAPYKNMNSVHLSTSEITRYKLFDTIESFLFHQRNPELTATLPRVPTDRKTSHTSKFIFEHLFDRLKRYDSQSNTTSNENTNYYENTSTLVFTPTRTKNISKIRDLSTFYDKVKFFEIYDDSTKNSKHKFKKIESNESDLIRNFGNFDNITRCITAECKEVSLKTESSKVQETTNDLKYIKEREEINNDDISDKITKDLNVLSWEEYPFVAVYIYQPLQVYCDAAAISSHWLITTGHCLSQTHKNKLYGKKHSAYVTYCSSTWNKPERITYVKYSFIHPKFYANDEEQKYLYNVGVIQVVTPMSTCPAWAPALMVSHQFIPTNDASTVTTIGWGLDRFEGTPSSIELTKRRQSFSVDTASVTSGDCLPERLWAKRDLNTNVYCLRTREKGHVHGSLMMYQGRLVALYTQGGAPGYDQYTGLLKVVPWLNQVTKESTTEEFLPYN